MLANNDLEPEIFIESRGGMTQVEIDVRPFDPGPMIGSGGTMKFAIQAMLAGRAHPTSWNLVFRNTGNLQCPRLSKIAPAVEPMKAVLDAACRHWEVQGCFAKADVELSKSAVVGILTLEDVLANAQRGGVSRIARAIGKANGYRGTVIVEKPAFA